MTSELLPYRSRNSSIQEIVSRSPQRARIPMICSARSCINYSGRAEPVLVRIARPSVSAILFYLSNPCYVPGAGYTRASCGTMFPMNLDEQTFLHRLASNLTA